MSLLKKFFGDIDVFSAPPLLRARKQPQTSSYTSGVLSLVMAIFFAFVFANGIYQVLTYTKISSIQTDTKLSGQQVKADGLYFAVRVGYLQLEDSLANFNIQIFARLEDESTIQIDLQPCKSQKWAAIGENYYQQFTQYSLHNFFCPIQTQHLNIKKVYYASNSSFLYVNITKCKDKPYCNNETYQNQFIKQIQNKQGVIFVGVYFLDSLIAPNNRDSVSLTINTDVQLAFTMKRGIIATIQIGSFQISTDAGYFPVAQTQVITGNFVNSFRQTSIQIVDDTQSFGIIYIQMNRRFIFVQRTVGKFDEMLSYAGGLFAIIAGFLNFFMFSYNEYRYELMVAEGVCSNDDNGNIIHEDELTLCKYVKYTIFDWVKTLFCHQIDWKDCKLIDEAREEASSHLDVTNLFRKINSFEVALQHLLEENEKQCLALMKPQSLNKTRRDRLVLEYYSTVMQGQPATTIEQYKTAQSLLQFSLKIYQKSMKSNKNLRNNNSLESITDQVKQRMMTESRKSQSIDEIVKMFPDLIHAAQELQLDPDMNSIQNQLSQAFFNLNSKSRAKIERQIPIKILIRLGLKYDNLFKNNLSESNQSLYSGL